MTWIRRVHLGRAALQYAAHGWPVTPGACYAGSRFSCGRLDCPTRTCHPALERWAEAATHEAATVAAWWRQAPYSVLLPTGRAFDVLEVPAYLGAPAAFDSVRGPVAVSPAGRFMFFVRPGFALLPELESRLDVLHHGRDSWVPAPPSRLLDGAVRWVVPPEEVRWRLPDPYPVQEALVQVIGSTVSGHGSHNVVRTMATVEGRAPERVTN